MLTLRKWNGTSILLGNCNEVRDALERFGSIFNKRVADFFNDFIKDADLVDVFLGGFSFTWSNRWAQKMSKLDHFLVTSSLSNSQSLVFEKFILDHRFILFVKRVLIMVPYLFRSLIHGC